MKKMFLAAAVALSLCASAQQNYVSKVWVADKGNGTYRNPIIYADYSDPDVCRAGDDYYMTASSFNCFPGLPILHSKDMVNWTIVNHALPKMPPFEVFDIPQHGNGVWAPSIRYHNNEFYIYWGDPDYGIYMVKTKNPLNRWSEPVLVKGGKGLIDACPLWDEDGKVYLVHALAGSRATLKSVMVICELNADGTKALDEGRIVFDGHLGNETVEGAKFHKRNGYYYILAPAGGVATGWQLMLRSKNIYGPYESKIVQAQGKTKINGPHQGAWVDTPSGEDWFFHFQDVGVTGRITHLQPAAWKNDWLVIGNDKDGDGCGEPFTEHKKPNVGVTYPIATPQESDEFTSQTLSLQWQWYAHPKLIWSFCDAQNGVLRLFSAVQPDVQKYGNLLDCPNLLLQKFPAPDFTATTKVTFAPNPREKGERAGLIVMGWDYGVLSMENTADGVVLSQTECYKGDRKGKEVNNASVKLTSNTVYLRVNVKDGDKCNFSYSYDGNKFTPLGKEFKAIEGRWIGAKVGLFCNRAKTSNDAGWIDVDYFRIDK